MFCKFFFVVHNNIQNSFVQGHLKMKPGSVGKLKHFLMFYIHNPVS